MHHRVGAQALAFLTAGASVVTPGLAVCHQERWCRAVGDISKSLSSLSDIATVTASTGGTVYATIHGAIMVDGGGAAIPLSRHTAISDFGAIVLPTPYRTTTMTASPFD